MRVEEKRKRPIDGHHPPPLRIKDDSHAIRKPSPSFEKTRLPKLNYRATHAPPPPKIIHTNVRDFKSLVQRLTGNEAVKNGKRPLNDVVGDDHHCSKESSSSSFKPIIPQCYLASDHPYLVDNNMPFPYLGHGGIPNSMTFSSSPLAPVYTYADAISFATLPSIGSSISPVKKEFLDTGTINGFGTLNDRQRWPFVFKGKMEFPLHGKK